MSNIACTRAAIPRGAARRCSAWLTPALAALLALPAASGAPACPDSLPPGLSAASIGQDVSVDGLRMAILRVETTATAEQTLSSVEAQWRALGFPVRRRTLPGWRVLSVAGPHCLATLQLAGRGAASGYFARSRPDPISSRTVAAARALLPAGTRVTSTMSSTDDGRHGVVISMTSNSSPERLQQAIGERLLAQKWAAPRSHTVRNAATGVTAWFVSAQRRRERFELVAWRDGAIQAVMTVAEAL